MEHPYFAVWRTCSCSPAALLRSSCPPVLCSPSPLSSLLHASSLTCAAVNRLATLIPRACGGSQPVATPSSPAARLLSHPLLLLLTFSKRSDQCDESRT
eukprot:244939-Hanusia_phi.AAC.3